MAQGKVYASYKRADWANPDSTDVGLLPGVYIGEVKEIISGSRAGAVRVYISELGTAPDDESGWISVNYASPFMGSTLGSSYTGVNQLNIYEFSPQSYGFFMTPPDVGNHVLCCFPPGKSFIGYWFACISNNLSKYNIPAGAPSTKYENIDGVSLTTGLGAAAYPYMTAGAPYPVGDFNGNDPATLNSEWVNNLRPINGYATFQLIRVGLDTDITRGAITSSVQRDPISSVYGFNTPGRPIPQEDVANIKDLQTQIATGQLDPAALKVGARVPGHSLVMDDGDLYNKNNLVRLKTAAGHQIMMNDSEGFIYVSNSEGTAWVELTKEGDVLIYNSRDLSVRSQGNIQLHSDRNILMNARGAIKLNAAAVQLEGSQAVTAHGGEAIQLYGGSVSLSGQRSTSIAAGASMSIKATGKMSLDAALIGLNSGGPGIPPTPPKKFDKFSNPDAVWDNGWAAKTDSLQSICYRVPTHEPYIRGNIATVIQQQEEIAREFLSTVEDDQTNDVTYLPDAEGGQSTAGFAETDPRRLDIGDLGPVKKPAPESSFIAQADPGKFIGVLDNNDVRAYMAQTGFTESSGNYTATNQYGYAGKYQFGSAALQDLGYIKPGTPQTKEALNNPNNWIGGPGKPASLADFLSNPGLQDQAMVSYTERNYKTLERTGVITAATPKDQIAGFLSASHLLGAGATTNWYNGKLSGSASDANGTTIESYFQQGRYSQTQVPTIIASETSKAIVT